jgi:hypothetical protein
MKEDKKVKGESHLSAATQMEASINYQRGKKMSDS